MNNKPKFDPSKPFEAADKPKFNPDKGFSVGPASVPGLEDQGEAPSKSIIGASLQQVPSTAGAAGLQAAKDLSLGWSPDLVEKLSGMPVAEQEAFLEAHPGGKFLGHAGAAGAAILGPGLPGLSKYLVASEEAPLIVNSAKALGVSAKTAARLFRPLVAGAEGGALGFATKAKDMDERLSNTRIGGELGGGLSSTAELLSAYLGRGGRDVESVLRAIGTTSADSADLNPEQRKQLAETILKNKVLDNGLGVPVGIRGINKNIEELKNTSGKAVGDVIGQLPNEPIISRQKTARMVQDELSPNPVARDFVEQQGKLSKHLTDMIEAGDLTPQEAQTLKMQLRTKANVGSNGFAPSLDEAQALQVNKAEGNALANQLDEQVGVHNPAGLEDYLSNKKTYGQALKAKDITQAATDRAAFKQPRGEASTASIGHYLGSKLSQTPFPAAYAKFLNQGVNPASTAYGSNVIWNLLQPQQSQEP